MMRTALIAILLASFGGGAASAKAIVLDCHVHSQKPGYRRDGVRRLQLDLAAKSVTVLDNTGKGFVLRGTRPIVGADAHRIVLENSGGKSAVLDRKTGHYLFRNDAEKLVIEGHCQVLGRDANPI
jgi:hypothetical protein